MHKPFGIRSYLYKRAKVHKASNFALKFLSRHILTSKVNNFFLRRLRGAILSSHKNSAVFVNSYVVALRSLSYTVDGLSSGTNHKTDLINFYFYYEDFRGARRNVRTRPREHLLNDVQNLKTRLFCLSKRLHKCGKWNS